MEEKQPKAKKISDQKDKQDGTKQMNSKTKYNSRLIVFGLVILIICMLIFLLFLLVFSSKITFPRLKPDSEYNEVTIKNNETASPTTTTVSNEIPFNLYVGEYIADSSMVIYYESSNSSDICSQDKNLGSARSGIFKHLNQNEMLDNKCILYSDLKNPKLVFSNSSVMSYMYDYIKVGNYLYLSIVVLGDNDYEEPLSKTSNHIIQFDTITGQIRTIRDHAMTSYANEPGKELNTPPSFLDYKYENYLFVEFFECYQCGAEAPPVIYVYNTLTGNRVLLGEAGNLIFGENKVFYQVYSDFPSNKESDMDLCDYSNFRCVMGTISKLSDKVYQADLP